MRRMIGLVWLFALTWDSGAVGAEDWPRFRGPNGSAVSAETGLPTTWSDSQDIAWKVDLPGPGSSSPIVSAGRVFVTCYSGYGTGRSDTGDLGKLTRHLLCLNLADGKVLWQKSVPSTVREDPYQGNLRDHGYATATPAADGQQVFTFFGKSGVYAFDWEGKQLWQTSVGTGSAMMGWGSAASPVLTKDLVVVNANAESQAIVALDKKTGRHVWKADAKGYNGSWSTPVLVEKPGSPAELVVKVPDEVWAIDSADGALAWYCTKVPGAATTSLVVKDGIVFAVGGGPFGAGSVAIRAGGRNDVSAKDVVWKKSAGSYVPSPVVVNGHLYWVDDRGTAYCLKADTGEQVYRERLSGAGGVYASVVAADGKLFAVTRRNGTFVLAASPQFKQLAQNKFSDSTDFNASPAIVPGHLLLRSNRALYCIGAK